MVVTRKKAKTIYQASIILACVLVVALVLTLIVQGIVKTNLKNRENALKEEKFRLEQEAENIKDLIEYRKGQEYIEKYARENGYINKDETVFYPN